MVILEGKDLTVSYGSRPVLDVPGIEVREGEILAVMGPNGGGKSTLLRILGLLERPTGGTVRFRGAPAPGSSRALLAIRRRFASVFQEPLLCDTTVRGNVALGLRLRHLRRLEAAKALDAWLSRLGIAHLANRPARTLSGGEAQRTSLARAFALQPDVLFLDEPFSALDPPTRDELLTLLQDLLRQERCTTIFVTHDREEALRLGDRIAVMMDGRLCQTGAPAEVFGHPNSEAVARFVGVETVLPGRVVEEHEGLLTVGVDGARIQALGQASVGRSMLVCLRPEDVVIRPPDAPLGIESARNRLEGQVVEVTRLAAQYRVEVACGPRVVALVTKQSFHDLNLAMGSRVIVSFKASAVHLIPR